MLLFFYNKEYNNFTVNVSITYFINTEILLYAIIIIDVKSHE